MIVVDASVVADFLLGAGSEAGDEMAVALADRSVLLAPHLLDAEVGQVLRRYVLRGEMTATDAEALLDDLVVLPIRRLPHGPLIHRAFALRDNVTVYDALYLALAESIGAHVWTGDAALQDVPGVALEVRRLRTGGGAVGPADRESPT